MDPINITTDYCTKYNDSNMLYALSQPVSIKSGFSASPDEQKNGTSFYTGFGILILIFIIFLLIMCIKDKTCSKFLALDLIFNSF
jgi:hypothetical protein